MAEREDTSISLKGSLISQNQRRPLGLEPVLSIEEVDAFLEAIPDFSTELSFPQVEGSDYFVQDLPEILEDIKSCNNDASDEFSLPIRTLDSQEKLLLDPDPKYDWIREIFDSKTDPGEGLLYPMFRREFDGRVRYQDYPHLDYRNRTGIR